MTGLARALSRILLLWLLLLSAAAASGEGLLWQVSGNGADGYLFGTMHSEDPRVTRLSPEVERRFNGAETLMLEVSLDEQTAMAVAMRMRLPPQQTLSGLVGEVLASQARQAMQERGIPPEATERMQPWATVLTLSTPKPESGLVLDTLLYQRALREGKAFFALESADEQLAVFDGLALDEQRALLQSVLQEYRDYPQLFEQMTVAYLERDLDRLAAISNSQLSSDDQALQQKLMRRLLGQRNYRMVERMEPQLKQGKVFIAIGALHLPGKEGVVELLRQRGYQLTPLDSR